MPTVPERQPSSGESTAEIQLLRSADDTGRIPFPEGNHREIAAFLEALSRLDTKGHVQHRFQNGLFGCFLTDSGKRLRSGLIEAPAEDCPESSETSALHHPPRQALIVMTIGTLLGLALPTQARLGEAPGRLEAGYGAPLMLTTRSL